MNELPEMLDQKEVMKLLKISRATLVRLRKQGKIEAVKVSERNIRFRRDDVIEILQNGI